MLENQYKELAEAVDLIAEKIRSLGFIAPGTFNEFINMADIQDTAMQDSSDMLDDLQSCHEITITSLRNLAKISEEHGYKAIEDLAIQRVHEHEKSLWMLKSSHN